MEQPIIISFGISRTFVIYSKELSCCLDDTIKLNHTEISQEKLPASLVFLESIFGSITMMAYKNITVRRRSAKLYSIIAWSPSSLTPATIDAVRKQTQTYTLKHENPHS